MKRQIDIVSSVPKKEKKKKLYSGPLKPLDNVELDRICDKIFANTGSKYWGAVAAHELPPEGRLLKAVANLEHDDAGVGIIANTDTRDLPGAHWVAFWFEGGMKPYFFDSSAKTPEELGHKDWDIYLKEVGKELTTMPGYDQWDKVTQLENHNCGYLCALFLLLKTRGMDYPYTKPVSVLHLSEMLGDLRRFKRKDASVEHNILQDALGGGTQEASSPRASPGGVRRDEA